MPRALVLGLGVVAVAFVAAYAFLGDTEPGLGGSGPAATANGDDPHVVRDASNATGTVPGEAPRAVDHRLWLEWTGVQSLAAKEAAVVVTRAGQPIEAVVEVLARSTGADCSAVVRVIEGTQQTCRRAVAAPGEGLRVDLGLERTLDGRVVDGDGAPVEGVEVWTGGPLDQVSVTDAEGRFAATTCASKGVPVVARKGGRATTGTFVDVDAAVGAHVDLVLAPGADLVVQAAGTQATLHFARVVLLPPARATTATDAYPFWAQDLFADLALDADGRVRCEGLPDGSSVGVALAGPALARSAPVEVVVRPQSPPVAIPAKDVGRLRGLVVDENGEAVAAAEVEVRPANARSEALLLMPVDVPPPAAARGRSAADGTFELALATTREDLVVTARANGVAGELRVQAGTDRGLRLVLPARLQSGARFQVDPPVAGVAWSIRVDPWTETRFVELAKDTPFVRELAAPFAGDLRVRVADGKAWSTPRERTGLVVDGAFVLPPDLLR